MVCFFISAGGGQGDHPCKFTNNFFVRKIFWYNLLHQKFCVIILLVAGGGKMNCEKLTKDMKDTGEPPALRRQVQRQVVPGFLVPLRATRSESVS